MDVRSHGYTDWFTVDAIPGAPDIFFRVVAVLVRTRFGDATREDARRRAVLLAKQAQDARESAFWLAVVVVGDADGQNDGSRGNSSGFSAALREGRGYGSRGKEGGGG